MRIYIYRTNNYKVNVFKFIPKMRARVYVRTQQTIITTPTTSPGREQGNGHGGVRQGVYIRITT